MENVITKDVLLSDIIADPNQPRKYFDETEMVDLTNSVLAKGIIQRVLLRPVKGKTGKYMVVVGERRFRASLRVRDIDKTRTTIPADIREINDDDALDMQIVENLQRENVSPMEEAVAFQSLARKGRTNVDIGKKVGKSEFYIRQRLKLNNLIKEWQTALYMRRIDITVAIKISAFDADSQMDLWNDAENMQNNNTGHIDIDQNDLNKYSGKLFDATFDITDPNLDKEMGPCTGCQFNTAVASLFPSEETQPMCKKVSCFINKAYTAFQEQLNAAIADPDMILVNAEYHRPDDEVTKAIKKQGHSILDGRINSTFSIVKEPSKPDLSEDYDISNYKNNSHDLMMADYEKNVKQYEKEMAEFNKLITGGKYQKALSVLGSTRGKVLYLKMGKAPAPDASAMGGVAKSSGAIKDKQAAGSLTAADCTAEIGRIKERMARSETLDLHKIHLATLEVFNKRPELSSSKPKMMPMQKQDRGLLAYLLVEMIGTHNSVAGMPKYATSKDKYNESYFDELSKISDAQLALLIRVAVKRKWGSVNLQYGLHTSDCTIRIIARYLGIDIKKIEGAVATAAAKRIDSANKKIAEFEGKRKELSKPAVAKEKTADAKKAAPKKAAKKK